MAAPSGQKAHLPFQFIFGPNWGIQGRVRRAVL